MSTSTSINIEPIPIYDEHGDSFRVGTISSNLIPTPSGLIFVPEQKYLYTRNTVINITEGKVTKL